jgi:type IV pilus assembly protein PilX
VSTLIRQPIRRQQGMALISALLLLLVVTIMAVSMFRSYGMQEKMAGNTREKQRALNAAVSAQQYAEWFLSSGNAPPKTTCTALVPSTTGQVCDALINPLDDYTTVVPWNVGVTYMPFTTNAGNGVVSNVSNTPTGTGTTLSYYQTPTFYITDLGPGYGGEVYQIDALGYGGLANSVAVVESTYVLTNGNAICPDIHCP